MTAILNIWRGKVMTAQPLIIYPDGCRDVIWVQLPNAAPFWKVSSFDRTARLLNDVQGAAFCGYRLPPGAVIPPDLFHHLDPDDPDGGAQVIAALCHVPALSHDFLAECSLDPQANVARLARRMGLHLRSLQRLSQHHTGQTPLFWLRLVRARHALRAALNGAPLADAAFAAGYADQAHFTREVRGFYHRSPAKLVTDMQAMADILVPWA